MGQTPSGVPERFEEGVHERGLPRTGEPSPQRRPGQRLHQEVGDFRGSETTALVGLVLSRTCHIVFQHASLKSDPHGRGERSSALGPNATHGTRGGSEFALCRQIRRGGPYRGARLSREVPVKGGPGARSITARDGRVAKVVPGVPSNRFTSSASSRPRSRTCLFDIGSRSGEGGT